MMELSEKLEEPPKEIRGMFFAVPGGIVRAEIERIKNKNTDK